MMNTAGQYSRAAGVGIAYHPFLHDYIIDHCSMFDFVELPLDLYLDTARAALLDPGQRRLQQVTAVKSCVWRGSALSLGTVSSGDAAFPAYLVKTIRSLLGASQYTDVIGFSAAAGLPLGAAHAMPFTRAAANWIAARQRQAQVALGCQVLLTLPNTDIAAPMTDLDYADFLAVLAALGGTGFVVDATQFRQAGAAPDRLPAGHIAALSISSDTTRDWDMLAALAEHTAPQTIILRRDRQLFPLDTIGRDLLRAAKLLATPPTKPLPSQEPANSADPADLVDLRAYQSNLAGWLEPSVALPPPLLQVPALAREALVAKARSWQNWRSQVDDMHKAQQIAGFIAKRSGPRLPWGSS